MDHRQHSKQEKSNLWSTFRHQYSGAITPIALSAISAWLIVTGIKGLLGFTINSQTAFADLIGIVVVVAIARWMQFRSHPK